MSITNLGNQYITFDYRHPATGRDFNTLLRGSIKPGIYSGGEITITGANTISVAPFIAYLYSGTDKLVRVETRTAVALTIAESTPVLSITLPWADVAENWLDWNQRAHASAVITNEVCLGEMVFVANAINSIDYTVKNWGKQLISNVIDGISPMSITSETLVEHLNADMVDDAHKSIDGTFASNSDLLIPTEKAIKTFADFTYLRNDYVISTQAEFDAIFTGTIPENTSIFLKKKSTPYLLNYAVVLSSGVRITSDGAIVNRNSATARFSTTYKNSATYSSGGAVGATTFVRTAGTAFVAGDIIAWANGKELYEVLSDTTTPSVDGTVTLTTPIIVTPTSGTVYAFTKNIYTDGWTFDGQNNVKSLGGSYTSGFSGNGGAFYIPYCANSYFKARVTNSKVATEFAGGAYCGDVDTWGLTYNVHIEKVDNCSATYGGGCAYLYLVTVTDVASCEASDGSTGGLGGGCFAVSHSSISDIRSCVAIARGGGCYGCHYSKISNIRFCRVTSVTGSGGGCYTCDYAIIESVSECYSAGSGGGLGNCLYSSISDVSNCVATGNGGGCESCDFCRISNVTGCTGASGGGCYDCTNIFLSGYFDNEGTVDNIDNCTYMGQLSYKNNAGTVTHVQTSGTSLNTTDLH